MSINRGFKELFYIQRKKLARWGEREGRDERGGVNKEGEGREERGIYGGRRGEGGEERDR